MFTGSAVFLILVVFLRSVYFTVSVFWWGVWGRRPSLHYRKDSQLCLGIARSCSTLTEEYKPPLVWGASGHVQTAFNLLIGHVFVPWPRGQRRSLLTPDGSTVTYDFFQPQDPPPSSLFFLLCPGIGNCSETCYIRSFVAYLLSNGHRVAVLNHIGTLQNTPLTGNRLFTYGGTGDLAAVFEDLISRHPSSKWVLVGFSLGANIGVRFIGERPEWRRKHFLCAVSVCQGYDPNQAIGILPSTSTLSSLYSQHIISKQLSLMRRHHSHLLGETPLLKLRDPKRRDCKVTHAGHDCNGFALDTSKITEPVNENLLWKAKSIHELDEYYTRRVLGFRSVRELWQWMSCEGLMKTVRDFPILLVNACDDPIVPEEVHSIAIQYTELNPYAMFVSTQHGGHLGFFEGGVILPNKATWLERLVLQYSIACREKYSPTSSTAHA